MNVQVMEFVSNSSVRVSWDSINNPMITNYTVYMIENYEGEVNESIIVPSSVNSVVIGNLTESINIDYQFQVAATAEINGEVIMGERSDAIRSVMPPTTASLVCKPYLYWIRILNKIMLLDDPSHLYYSYSYRSHTTRANWTNNWCYYFNYYCSSFGCGWNFSWLLAEEVAIANHYSCMYEAMYV